jgi:hypothetical protein
MVILEHKSGYKLGPEESQVAAALDELGRPYQIASLSQVERGRVSTVEASLVVGTIPFVQAALRQKGLSLQAEQTYPTVLNHLMRRQHRRTTLKAALDLYEARGVPMFVKPAVRAKRFTGLVLSSTTAWSLQGVSRNEPVWLVDPVTFTTEWRLYVDRGVIVHMACYAGDPSLNVDLTVAQEAVELLAGEPDLPKTYAIDFGVLDSGETALVELNEAYGVGAYEMGNRVLLNFLQAGWDQINK